MIPGNEGHSGLLTTIVEELTEYLRFENGVLEQKSIIRENYGQVGNVREEWKAIPGNQTAFIEKVLGQVKAEMLALQGQTLLTTLKETAYNMAIARPGDFSHASTESILRDADSILTWLRKPVPPL